MIDLEAFRVRFPEFKSVGNGVVQAALDESESQTDATVFGDQTDHAHAWLAAHILSSSPQGQGARITGKNDTSRYMGERNRIARYCCAGYGTLPD